MTTTENTQQELLFSHLKDRLSLFAARVHNTRLMVSRGEYTEAAAKLEGLQTEILDLAVAVSIPTLPPVHGD